MKRISLHIVICLLFFATPTLAEVSADSAASYRWIRSLSDQNDLNLTPEILSLTNYYIFHFPKSKRNSEILQIQGNLHVQLKNYEAAFASFLKQITVYPDSNRDYNSTNALLLLFLKSKKLASRKSLIKYWINNNSASTSIKKKYLLYIKKLYLLNLHKTDQIALKEIQWILNRGFVKSNLDELLYEKAKILSRNKENREAFYTYLELMKEWPRSSYFPIALYNVADYYQNTIKNKQLALKLFVQLVRRYPNHQMTTLAHLHLAEIYESAFHRPKLAVREYANFINHSDDDILVADSYYRMAKIYENDLGNRAAAIILYERILHKYPEAKTASKAKRALKYLLNH